MSQKCFNVLFSFIIRASLLFCLEKSKEKIKAYLLTSFFIRLKAETFFSRTDLQEEYLVVYADTFIFAV